MARSFRSVGSLGAFPALLINPLRSALQSQGFDPGIVSDAGELNSAAIISSLVETVDFRTEWTTPITLSTKAAADGPHNPLWDVLKPTITLNGGKVGHKVIAPYGEAAPGGSNTALIAGVAGAFGLLGVGMLVGVLMSKGADRHAAAAH